MSSEYRYQYQQVMKRSTGQSADQMNENDRIDCIKDR